jgi:hypothetical protein
MARAVGYIKTTLRQLPNLVASRDTIRFEDTPPELQTEGNIAPSGTFIPAQPLHPISRSTRTVAYRDGEEIDETAGEEQGASASGMTGLTTVGEFGPLLAAVFSDLPQGRIAWSHWEQASAKPVAVFRFQVPKGVSHYEVKFCCVGGRVFQQSPAYHGEVSIDPADGTILRLTLISDLGKADPIAKAELMVEYGPVELGRKTFFCPVKSISDTVAPVQLNHKTALPKGASFPTASGNVRLDIQENSAEEAPLQTMLNEVIFDQFHFFQSEARILTGEDSRPASTPAPSSAANP